MSSAHLFSFMCDHLLTSIPLHLLDMPDIRTLLRWYPGSAVLSALPTSTPTTPPIQTDCYFYEIRPQEHRQLQSHLLYLKNASRMTGSAWPTTLHAHCANGIDALLSALKTNTNDSSQIISPHSHTPSTSPTSALRFDDNTHAVVLIDPPYENDSDSDRLEHAIAQLSSRPHTTTLVWYPITDRVIIPSLPNGTVNWSIVFTPSPLSAMKTTRVLPTKSASIHNSQQSPSTQPQAPQAQLSFGIHVINGATELKTLVQDALPLLEAHFNIKSALVSTNSELRKYQPRLAHIRPPASHLAPAPAGSRSQSYPHSQPYQKFRHFTPHPHPSSPPNAKASGRAFVKQSPKQRGMPSPSHFAPQHAFRKSKFGQSQ